MAQWFDITASQADNIGSNIGPHQIQLNSGFYQIQVRNYVSLPRAHGINGEGKHREGLNDVCDVPNSQ